MKTIAERRKETAKKLAAEAAEKQQALVVVESGKPGFWQRTAQKIVRGFKSPVELSDAELAYANSQAALAMVEALARVQVQTTYGLTEEGVAQMFRAGAETVADGIKGDKASPDNAGTLAIVGAMLGVANRLEGEK